MTLNRNPKNFFAEVEQVAFSPSATVNGIEPSEDKLLQGRLFSYPIHSVIVLVQITYKFL